MYTVLNLAENIRWRSTALRYDIDSVHGERPIHVCMCDQSYVVLSHSSTCNWKTAIHVAPDLNIQEAYLNN